MKQMIKVLLADDHPMFLEGVRNALQKFAHIEVVAECTDGHAVEKYIGGHSVDVVVLDVNMPGKSGVELAKLIRSEYPHIKVVLLTMYHPGALPPENPVSAFIHGYVLKNSGSLVLCQAIETAFSGKTYLDPKLKDVLPIAATDYLPSAIKLSSREKEIIKLVIQGKGNRDIAGQLFLSELTIKTHRKNIYQKLEVNNVAGLIQKINTLSIDLSYQG